MLGHVPGKLYLGLVPKWPTLWALVPEEGSKMTSRTKFPSGVFFLPEGGVVVAETDKDFKWLGAQEQSQEA